MVGSFKIATVISALFAFESLAQNEQGTQEKQKCYALSLEGGANRGAFEAGALQGLVDNLPQDQVEYDVVTGVSAGSINGYFISLYKKGDEVQLGQDITDLWSKLTNKDIWIEWPKGGMVHGLFKESGILDNYPLLDLLTREGAKKNFEFHRDFACSAVDISDGSFKTFYQKDYDPKEFQNAVVASGSMPFVFPMKEFQGHYYMDGGTQNNINLNTAVQMCRDKGFQDKDIILDLMLAGYFGAHSHKYSRNAWANYQSVQDIQKSYNNVNAIQQFLEAIPDVNVRYIVAPRIKFHLPQGMELLEFHGHLVDKMLAQGRKAGKDAVKRGPQHIPNLLNEWHSVVNQTEYESFHHYIEEQDQFYGVELEDYDDEE